MRRFPVRIAIPTLAALAASASVTSAQCVPAWDPTLGQPGITDGYVAPMTLWDDGGGEAIFAGGSFGRIGNVAAPLIGRYDLNSGSWSRLGGGLDRGNTNGFVTAIVPFQGRLVVGGFFRDASDVPDTQSIASWDGAAWHSLGGMLVPPDAVWNLTVGSLPGEQESLYAVGGFASMGGVSGRGVAAYDGTQWRAVGNGVGIAGAFSPYATAALVYDDGSGPALYIAGRFDSVDNIPAASIARWDGQRWNRVGNGIASTNTLFGMEAMTVFDDGNGPALYVAGYAHRINGQGGTYNVLRWDGRQWSGVGSQIGTGRITSITAFDDGNGPRMVVGGTAMPQINQFATFENGQWTPYLGGVGDPAVPPSNFPSVFGLTALDDRLLVGGSFGSTGDDQPVAGLASIIACDDPCPPDLNDDGNVDGADFLVFLSLFFSGDDRADFNNDGVVDGADFLGFLQAFFEGC